VLLETVQRCDVSSVAQGGKARNAVIDADGCGGSGRWGMSRSVWILMYHLPPDSLRGHVPRHARNVPAVAVAHPIQFRQLDAAVGLIDLKLLGIGGSASGRLVLSS